MSLSDLNCYDDLGLQELETKLRTDLNCLGIPSKNWVPRRDGVADVVIVGGGMCGMVAWLSLITGGMQNIRILDRAIEGYEGPWLTYARMETLRSPKDLTGPAFSHGGLTFQAWYRAQFGVTKWNALDRILRPMWMDYLRWYRHVLNIPIENGISLDHVENKGDLLRLQVSGMTDETILCRKLIFATGRDGTGSPNIPSFVDGLSQDFWAHCAHEINFSMLKNKCVAVIGVGASAVDNAAEALEHGATEVRHLIRRKEMPTINKMMGIGSFGFTAGYAALPDEWRWRFMQYSFATQTPPPHGSTLRVSRHKNAYFHFDKETIKIQQHGDKAKIYFSDNTSYLADFVILGTGFKIDPLARTEFGKNAGNILLWKDVYTPPKDEKNDELGCFPYLNPDFSFCEKVAETAPWLKNVFCFNYGASASLGKVSGDIPGISEGAAWLARAIASQLYSEDIEEHWQLMLNYKKPELQGHEWTPTELHPNKDQGKVA